MCTTLACFTSRCVGLTKKATVGPPGQAVQKGDGGYADWLIIALHRLKEHLGHPYRQLMDVLTEMPRIVRRLELTLEELPHFTDRLPWQRTALHAELAAVSRPYGRPPGPRYGPSDRRQRFDRIAASRKYATRTDYTFQAMKTTMLVDCASGTILDVHCSPKQLHDTQISRQVFARNLDRISTWAQNQLHDEAVYNQRTASETGIRVLKQRFGDRLWARTWYGQFRELVIWCAVKNIEDHVKATR